MRVFSPNPVDNCKIHVISIDYILSDSNWSIFFKSGKLKFLPEAGILRMLIRMRMLNWFVNCAAYTETNSDEAISKRTKCSIRALRC